MLPYNSILKYVYICKTLQILKCPIILSSYFLWNTCMVQVVMWHFGDQQVPAVIDHIKRPCVGLCVDNVKCILRS